MTTLPPLAADALIVAVLIGAGLLQQFGAPHPEHEAPGAPNQLVHGAVIVGAILPLLLRRRFPLLTVVLMSTVIGVAGSFGPLLAYDPSPAAAFGLIFATYNATALGTRAQGWVAVAISWVAVTLVLRPWVTPVAAWLPNYPYYVVAFLAGRAQRQRRELSSMLQEQLLDEEEHRDRLRQLSLQEARVALGRDLHDVVVAAVQRARSHAMEALRRLDTREADAESSVRAAEEAGIGALADMRRMLAVLRRDGAQSPARREPRGYDGVAPTRPPASVLRRLGRSGVFVDVSLVAVLVTGALLEFRSWKATIGAVVPPEVFSTAAHIWAVAWILLLLLRRHAPVATGVAMAVMAFLQTYPFGYWTPVSDIAALQIAVYTIGTLEPKRAHAWVVAVLGAIGVVSIPPPPLHLGLVGFLVIVTVTLFGAAYVGTIVGERRSQNAELDRRLEALAEERRVEVELALHQDRLALAREMHDLVAHSLTLMVVQAGAGRTVAATDPTAACQALQAVVDIGKQATDELQQLLSLLQTGAAYEPLPPAGRDVDELVTRARQSGLQVDLARTGLHVPPAGSSLELSAYRILQEALTNVRKHAPGSRVRVHLTFDPDAVALRVESDPSAGSPLDLVSLGAGRGLVGMRERVAMFGGRFEAGPGAGGGFVVDARLPVDEVTQ